MIKAHYVLGGRCADKGGLVFCVAVFFLRFVSVVRLVVVGLVLQVLALCAGRGGLVFSVVELLFLLIFVFVAHFVEMGLRLVTEEMSQVNEAE